jgi:hypothetical protein
LACNRWKQARKAYCAEIEVQGILNRQDDLGSSSPSQSSPRAVDLRSARKHKWGYCIPRGTPQEHGCVQGRYCSWRGRSTRPGRPNHPSKIRVQRPATSSDLTVSFAAPVPSKAGSSDAATRRTDPRQPSFQSRRHKCFAATANGAFPANSSIAITANGRKGNWRRKAESASSDSLENLPALKSNRKRASEVGASQRHCEESACTPELKCEWYAPES